MAHVSQKYFGNTVSHLLSFLVMWFQCAIADLPKICCNCNCAPFVLAPSEAVYKLGCTATNHPVCFQNHQEHISNLSTYLPTKLKRRWASSARHKKQASDCSTISKTGWKFVRTWSMLRLCGIEMTQMQGKAKQLSRRSLSSPHVTEGAMKYTSMVTQTGFLFILEEYRLSNLHRLAVHKMSRTQKYTQSKMDRVALLPFQMKILEWLFFLARHPALKLLCWHEIDGMVNCLRWHILNFWHSKQSPSRAEKGNAMKEER